MAGALGLLLSRLALSGDGESDLSLVGRTLMAVVLGVVCAAVAALLLDDEPSPSAPRPR